MKLQSIESHPQLPVEMPGAEKAQIRMLIGPDDNAPTFYMRHFELAPGGCTPHHQHDSEHEILIFKGNGVAKTPDGDKPFAAGDVVFVPPGEMHGFVNTSDSPVEFICLIPAPAPCK